MKKNYLLSAVLLLCAAVNYGQSQFDCSKLDPIVESTEINLCEPGGEVTLEAQANTGSHIYWYESKSSNDIYAEGNSLDLGNITSDVSYWVSEAQIDIEVFDKLGAQGIKEMDRADTSVGLAFTAFEAFTLVDVEVFSGGNGGSIKVILMDEKENVVAEKVETIPVGDRYNPFAHPHTISLDFDVPGKGDYMLIFDADRVELSMMQSYPVDHTDFPYPLGKLGEITDAVMNEGRWVHVRQKFYGPFYNWTIKTEEFICESDRKEINVFVNDDYPDDLDVDSTYILCGDEDFVLGDIPIEANNLQWFNSDGDLLPASTIIEDGATYSVSDLSPGGCSSAETSITFQIQDISEQPVAETEQAFEEGITLADLEVEGENLLWYADEEMNEELSENTMLEDETTYYVTQTLENYCESEPLGITVLSSLGVADVSFENLQYNNPVSNILYVSNSEAFEDIALYDITGKQLSIFVSFESSSYFNLDMSGLSSGTYLLSFNVNGARKTVQIIKE